MNIGSVLLPARLYCFICSALSVCDVCDAAIMPDNAVCLAVDD